MSGVQIKSIGILLADDHEMIRKGLRLTLQTRPDWQVIDEAASGREALEKVCMLNPEVVVMDVSMPELTGTEATRRIKQERPCTRILILTMHDTRKVVERVLAAGADGYLLKSDTSRELIRAIEAVLDGKPYFTSQVARMVLEGFLRTPGVSDQEQLTSREREILQLIAEGRSTKEIARDLDIGVKTADSHRTNLMRKIGAKSVAEVVRYAVREGIVEP
jgi:DNA-binding NarL/FixJ family response regulator